MNGVHVGSKPRYGFQPFGVQSPPEAEAFFVNLYVNFDVLESANVT